MRELNPQLWTFRLLTRIAAGLQAIRFASHAAEPAKAVLVFSAWLSREERDLAGLLKPTFAAWRLRRSPAVGRPSRCVAILVVLAVDMARISCQFQPNASQLPFAARRCDSLLNLGYCRVCAVIEQVEVTKIMIFQTKSRLPFP
jgi:hypothetical protein